MSREVIGIDLGGTGIKLGRVGTDGNLIKTISVPTPQPANPEDVFATIVEAIAFLDPDGISTAIGVGLPGPTDARGRIAKVSINLPGWVDIPLADWLEAKFHKPTIIANDANCAGLGEAWLGAGRNFPNFILLTLGTGVGGAIIFNGELFSGHYGAAGELGLITLYPDGPTCNSGNNGSLEQFVSIRAIRRRTGLEPAELGVLAANGDSRALEFWQEYGRDLGIGISSLVYVLTPDAVILGGGVSGSAKFFLPATRAEVERRVLFTSRENLQIIPAQLGNQAGIFGAAKIAFEVIGMGEKGKLV
ncbi:ROK family protein [Calothrix sp. NIES-3974]|uniref:ROK family protein n=1 Tax=Calothrix sp. NIES-3974 TaxID=2005462 RepID=UPI000B5F104F|nr:ROK family protein [Calothrix sp. NIES-3974]BAZ05543.1 ROK family protein [Calothrix sp. NIES-3974]